MYNVLFSKNDGNTVAHSKSILQPNLPNSPSLLQKSWMCLVIVAVTLTLIDIGQTFEKELWTGNLTYSHPDPENIVNSPVLKLIDKP